MEHENQPKNIFPIFFILLKDFRKSNNTSDSLNFIEIDIKKITNTIIQTFSNSTVLVLSMLINVVDMIF